MIKRRIVEYPYNGVVTHVVQGVGRNEDTKEVIYEGVMDEHMQKDEEGRTLQTSTYIICMPLTKDVDGNYIIPRKGDEVSIDRLGETMNFVIDNVEPSQLDGISLYATRQDW